ncbi:hypothetical protein MYXO_00741 [Myxococcaceae bacterium]|jgi:hypothetical protein|nr:hypothetical protein MYXO_00741 [Myxococcaceae bacterium]
MSSLPQSSTPPAEFFEQWLPKAFAAAPVPEAAKSVDVKLGIRLEGAGGGEWIFHMDRGTLSVTPGSAEACAFTLIQSVDDWRGCLWEGRGGAFGKQAAAMFQPGAAQAGAGPSGRPMNPQAIERLGALRGVVRMVVSGGAGGDWKVDFKLGPGPVPAEPTTTVTVANDDAEAMGRGELDPMQAFMSGKIQIAGDMGLMMQMQAASM